LDYSTLFLLASDGISSTQAHDNISATQIGDGLGQAGLAQNLHFFGFPRRWTAGVIETVYLSKTDVSARLVIVKRNYYSVVLRSSSTVNTNLWATDYRIKCYFWTSSLWRREECCI
jgi:hypothetical protein